MQTAMNILLKTHLTKTKVSINRRKALCFALLLMFPSVQAMPLTCAMQITEAPSIERADVNFVLLNNSTETVQILPWNSAWEGWMGRFISISVDGNPLHYQGPMIKRGSPKPSDFVPMTPQESLNKTLNLKNVYKLIPGHYQIEYTGMISIKDAEQQMQLLELECPKLTFSITADIK